MEERLESGVDTLATSSTAESYGYCCLYHAALDSLTVPVVVHNDESVLYANPEAQRFLTLTDYLEAKRSVESVVHPDSADSARDRRRLILEQGASFQGVHLKLRRSDGRVLYVVADGSPIEFGDSSKAIVQLLRYIDGDSFVTYTPSNGKSAATNGPTPYTCMHHAAFETLPVPVVIQDRQRIVDANHHSRLVLADGDCLRDVSLRDVLHPDFIEAGVERRSVVLDQKHPYRGLSAKLRSQDGKTVYIIVDGAPVEYGDEPLAVLVARDVRVH